MESKAQETLEGILERHRERIAGSFRRALTEALSQYGTLHLAGEKCGVPAHIYISFMLSGALCGLPLLRIDIYDERDRDDMSECHVNWDVPDVSAKLHRNADGVASEVGRIKDYDTDRIRLELADVFHETLKGWLPGIISAVSDALPKGASVYFGHFLGSASVMEVPDGVL